MIESVPAGGAVVIDPLSAMCPACLANPGQRCIATSSDLPREHPHKLRGFAAALRLRRCPACAACAGWTPSPRRQFGPSDLTCPVCAAPPSAACTEAGVGREGYHEVRIRAAVLDLQPCQECGGIGWQPDGLELGPPTRPEEGRRA